MVNPKRKHGKKVRVRSDYYAGRTWSPNYAAEPVRFDENGDGVVIFPHPKDDPAGDKSAALQYSIDSSRIIHEVPAKAAS